MSVRYRIYPSLLDKFQSFLDAEQATEEWWNLDSEGEYKLTADEMSDKLEKELLDAVNRVPHEPIEAADKGTCFNEVIDCLIARRKCEYEGMDISSGELAGNRVITAKLNGFEFNYDLSLCKEIADALKGAISQHECRAILPTKYGEVELYGYADEIVADEVVDIKTTSRYDFGKFSKGWQKHLYPYCLVHSGEVASVSGFEYLVVVWKGGTSRTPVLSGNVYEEYYTYDHHKSTVALTMICERFIEWLEAHKDQITDKKIFGGENEPVLVEKHGVMTKDEFKALWEANETGSGLNYDDIAENARAWGVCSKPRSMRIDHVRYLVLLAAHCKDAEFYKPVDWEE